MTKERLYHTLRLCLLKDDWKRAEYLKKHHLLHGIGEHCQWGPLKLPLYPNLIKIGNNVTIHRDVQIIPHDMINQFLKYYKPEFDFGCKEVVGCIDIGNNVYISTGVIILPNVKIGDNCIISCGSVISQDIPENSIVAGNPAQVIGKFSVYAALRKMNAANNPVIMNQYLNDEQAIKIWKKFEQHHQKNH